ncbi:hypothetical protein AGABI1DRAFT_92891 [Agaricus bisporus var. burnettii JB137-S8]|uniref:Uncharacterized protein n=1 Tax=Agaricus bisporus var. burnettii (strain JB137-S8 / ATCC MYA-4627 / FGSC 10392) TaxID=597362 RepID=K5WRD9_AGABU|nr:uncharacterized protein AGABI1DRAFT_92891 [Agaricus bisporus var. burnettii JB137-S8]EKM77961.1 hypothetical protein AGABI1DRAFT_92891 [Agaricus bisporus var. burnettii JB137-S8]
MSGYRSRPYSTSEFLVRSLASGPGGRYELMVLTFFVGPGACSAEPHHLLAPCGWHLPSRLAGDGGHSVPLVHIIDGNRLTIYYYSIVFNAGSTTDEAMDFFSHYQEALRGGNFQFDATHFWQALAEGGEVTGKGMNETLRPCYAELPTLSLWHYNILSTHIQIAKGVATEQFPL